MAAEPTPMMSERATASPDVQSQASPPANPSSPKGPTSGQAYPAIHRLYATVRPWGQKDYSGLITDFGYEYINGINVGVELSPIVIGDEAVSSFMVRVKLGYGGKYIAAGATLSSGYPGYFPELGLAGRLGRLDKVYISGRFAWLVKPAVWLPVDAAFELRVPVHKRWAIHVDAYGGYTATYPFIVVTSAGIGYTLRGEGLTNTTILNLGAGPIFYGLLGGCGLVGIEHRL